MKRLVVVVNDLERSGKSSVSRAVYHHLASECEIKSFLVTSDENNLDEDYDGEYWDLDESLSVGQVIGLLEENDAVIFDVHTGGARNWAEFCEETEFDNVLAEVGAEMTLVIPNTGGVRCNEEIIDIAELFSDSADYLIAHLGIDQRDQVKWKGSDAEKATRYLGSIDVEFPSISEELATAIKNTDYDFSVALGKGAELPRFAEVQIAQWLEEVSNRLDSANEYILADGSELALEF
ncbi:MAG: hypothetical protein P1U89_07340 [Verrucomicrobiales bacterium]|nr:hypothetical protein [Verrucomicrobiales bacterium]